MDYRKIYEDLICMAKTRGSCTGYMEKHHVIPDFMFKHRKRSGKLGHLPGDPNDSSNLVMLTPREHAIAHMLLCKIHRGSRYEHQCLSSLLIMLNGGGKGSKLSLNRRALRESLGKTRLYQSLKSKAKESLSRMYTGKIMAKDLETGKIVGMVDKTHPNVLSGKWRHHSHGRKCTQEHRDKVSLSSRGLANGNSKGYTDDQLLNSYIECCRRIGSIASMPIWHAHSEKFQLPFLKHINQFHFNGNGFMGMRALAEASLNQTYKEDRKKSKQLITLWR